MNYDQASDSSRMPRAASAYTVAVVAEIMREDGLDAWRRSTVVRSEQWRGREHGSTTGSASQWRFIFWA
jgi:hypothetical protein